MNAEKEKRLEALMRYNPFWVCFLVFLLLAGDYAFRLVNLLNQREQLNQAVLMQAQNMGTLTRARELEARIEGFSLDLLQLAKTNAAANRIVQDFNIQWNPGPTSTNALAPGLTAVPAAPVPIKAPAGASK
jgi:hypothetical protein